jgi:hypothetical protein
VTIRFLLAALALTACSSATFVAPAEVDGSTDACVVACDRRAAMGCLEARLAASCVGVCRKAERAGLYDPRCVARAQRDEMAACRVRCDQ